MNFLANYSSEDEKEGRSEEFDRKYKPDASKNDHLKMREFDVERKNAHSSRGKKDNPKPTNKETIGYRSSINQEKERKHHSYDDDKGKDRKKEYHNYRTERHKEKSKDFDRDKRTNDYDSKRREHHSRYEKYRKEKRYTADDHNPRDKHRRRRSVSPREKRDHNERDSNRKCKETTEFANESTSHKNIDTKEHKNNIQNIIPIASTTLFTTPQHTDSTLKSSELQPETSIKLPSYYNPSVINPNKFADQVQKRKLLWSNKKDEDTSASKWGGAKFAQDSDGKVASKFMRLMGIKSAPKSDDENHIKPESTSTEHVQERETMFSNMEQQYEVARQVTHTMRGVGLGFSSQNRPF